MDKVLVRQLLACIDNTTLNGTDTIKHVEAFCRRTLNLAQGGGGAVAAVCVYPQFVATASRMLSGSGIKVAAVAGAFPHGQLPIALKRAEVDWCANAGADEIDIVINRGLLLEGNDDEVCNEVAIMREACPNQRLKVILETGELPSQDDVARAARIAIDGGADFIKTSTGKIAVGATLQAAETMLHVIADHRQQTGRTVGFKAAGGISTPDEALAYAQLAQRIMGNDYLSPATFRIGASRLTDKLYALL